MDCIVSEFQLQHGILRCTRGGDRRVELLLGRVVNRSAEARAAREVDRAAGSRWPRRCSQWCMSPSLVWSSALRIVGCGDRAHVGGRNGRQRGHAHSRACSSSVRVRASQRAGAGRSGSSSGNRFPTTVGNASADENSDAAPQRARLPKRAKFSPSAVGNVAAASPAAASSSFVAAPPRPSRFRHHPISLRRTISSSGWVGNLAALCTRAAARNLCSRRADRSRSNDDGWKLARRMSMCSSYRHRSSFNSNHTNPLSAEISARWLHSTGVRRPVGFSSFYD